MISSAVFVHTNGRGLSFQSAIQERMSASRACTDVWVPRRIIWSVRKPNHRSTWFTHDELVGGEVHVSDALTDRVRHAAGPRPPVPSSLDAAGRRRKGDHAMDGA